MGWAKSMPFEELKRNALMLAKSAAILNMPVGHRPEQLLTVQGRSPAVHPPCQRVLSILFT